MNRTIGAGNYLLPVKSDGTDAVATDSERGYYTLASSTVYYVDVPVKTATHVDLHLQWTSALIGTITFESSSMGAAEVALTSTTDGDWIEQDPSTAYVPIIGTGASVSNLTISLAGGGAGGCEVNLSALAWARMRIKVDVTTGGSLRVSHYSKE